MTLLALESAVLCGVFCYPIWLACPSTLKNDPFGWWIMWSYYHGWQDKIQTLSSDVQSGPRLTFWLHILPFWPPAIPQTHHAVATSSSLSTLFPLPEQIPPISHLPTPPWPSLPSQNSTSPVKYHILLGPVSTCQSLPPTIPQTPTCDPIAICSNLCLKLVQHLAHGRSSKCFEKEALEKHEAGSIFSGSD